MHRLAPMDSLVAVAREWLAAKPTADAPWDRKGFQVPGGAGPLATPARDLFVNGVARALRAGACHAPAALAILSCVYEGTIVGFDTGLRIESKYFGTLLSGATARNLMRTLFASGYRWDLRSPPS